MNRLKRLYIDGVSGLTYIEHPDLVQVQEIFQVYREGKPLVPVTTTPTGRQCRYEASEGRIYLPADMPVTSMLVDNPSLPYDVYETETFYVKFLSVQ